MTVEDYHRLAELGILGKIELLEGRVLLNGRYELVFSPEQVADARRAGITADLRTCEAAEREPPLAELRYDGSLYVRPVGRGIVLEDLDEYVDEVVERLIGEALGRHPDNEYLRARLRVEVLAVEPATPPG